jgi:hypothetical protein
MVKAPQVGQKVLVVARVEEKELHQARVLVLAREERKVPVSEVVHPARFQQLQCTKRGWGAGIIVCSPCS